MTVKRYRRKSQHIEALKWTGKNFPEVEYFVKPRVISEEKSSLYGLGFAIFVDEWIIKDKDGGIYAMGDEEFKEEYEDLQ